MENELPDVTEEQSAFTQELDEQNDTAEDSSPEPNETETDPSQEGDNTPDEKRVPYDRFKEVYEKSKHYEEELESLKQQFSQIQQATPSSPNLPDWWTEIYGGDELSQRAYQGHLKMLEEQKENMFQELTKRQQEEQLAQQQEIERYRQQIHDNLQVLQDKYSTPFLGEDQGAKDNRNELLSIIEEYSPEGGDWIPFEKAYEILSLKREKRSLSEGRKKAAQLTSATSKGEGKPQKRVIGGWHS